jgi:hypothetical protein
MPEFDLKGLFHRLEAGVEKLRKEEKRKYPENRLFLRSERQINDEFKEALDEVKREAGFLPGEIYISTRSDGELVVNLGVTLLKIEVLFRITINIRSVSRKYRKKNKSFSFERRVAEEYDRCIFEYERLRRELKSTWRACDVPPGDLERAIRSVEEDCRNASRKLAAFKRNNCSDAAIKQAESEVASLNLLFNQLQKFNSRRA